MTIDKLLDKLDKTAVCGIKEDSLPKSLSGSYCHSAHFDCKHKYKEKGDKNNFCNYVKKRDELVKYEIQQRYK